MGKLLRMDLYRMRKAKSFWVCLILAFLFGLLSTPGVKLMTVVAGLVSNEKNLFPATADLSGIIKAPFPILNAMLALLSVNSFFYADVENGYIKNIAGQMPKRGYTIFSKFLAVIPHNLLFIIVGVGGNLIGTIVFQKIIVDGAVLEACGILLLKLLLIQSLCTILLLVTATFQSKSFGTVLAVLFGLGLLFLVYTGIDAGLDQLWPKKSFSIVSYMPDQLLDSASPDAVRSLVVSAVTIVIFLFPSIRIFDKKDVK